MSGIQRTGSIYFARVSDYVKIGYASNPRQRVERLLAPGTRLIIPAGVDRSQTPDLILVVPFCSQRDERNMHLLFGNHWAEGEWFHWSPAFERQMRGMCFVTNALRRKDRADIRRMYGGAPSHQREERWGMETHELLAHLAEWRRDHALPRAA